jgi:chaperonin GroES
LALVCHFGSFNDDGTLFEIDEMSANKVCSMMLLRSLMMKKTIKTTNTMSKIQPLADRVLVKPAAAEEKTVGGIIIPDSAKEKPLRGEVLAVGEGTKDEAMVLKAGDKVLYGKYAGTELELDGEKYLIMRQSDVLAKIC